MRLKGYTAFEGELFPHDHRSFESPGFEDKSSRGCRKIVTNETSSRCERFINHFLIGRNVTCQRFGDEDMCVHCSKMKVIWEDYAMERSHVHMERVRVGASDGNDMLSVGKQVIPALNCFKHGMMSNEIWKKGVERAMQFGRDNRLEFAQPVPEFDACVIANIPCFPGNVRFAEGGRFGIAWVSDKG